MVMSFDKLTPNERLMSAIDFELDFDDQIEVPNLLDTPKRLADLGKKAITTLYVEGILAVDDLPKKRETDFKKLLGSHLAKTALTDKAFAALIVIDQAVELNPLYDQASYAKSKRTLNWRNPSYQAPLSFLTNLRKRSVLPERGLAALSIGTEDGFSTKLPPEKSWQWMNPKALIGTMIMNETVDRDLLNKLRLIRASGRFTNQEYSAALLNVAKETTDILMRPKEDEPAENTESLEQVSTTPISMFDRACITLSGSIMGVAVGKIVSEGILHTPTAPSLGMVGLGVASGAFVGYRKSGTYLVDINDV
jgi:hypothetical protein